ncbi:CoA transferase [Micromonospora sp. NPDC047074]|uniref:CoA transferase n=1 Tax=Micromonospora sp. NPDC047074 TaxID=3154339 RepID=UPI0033DEC782
MSGFGQIGPYAPRPGFGTLAEAMSGFAAATGEPDGPPTLPPFGLADSVTALAAAYAIMLALRGRDLTGRGQVVDLAIIESIMAMRGPQITWCDQLGTCSPGWATVPTPPRNTYRCADGRDGCLSSTQHAQCRAGRTPLPWTRPQVSGPGGGAVAGPKSPERGGVVETRS